MKPTLSQLRTFIGNPAVYATQRADGGYTPVRERLSDKVLRDHLNEKVTVGTYMGTRTEAGISVTGSLCIDVDTGFETDAEELREALLKLRVPSPCIGIEFSGKKGYHVWVLFPYPVVNNHARRLGRAALALASMPMSTELYPRQDDIPEFTKKGDPGLGNLVKLPGGVHRVSGKRNDLITEVPRPMTVSEWGAVVGALPPEVTARSSYTGENRFPCIEDIQQEGVQEGARNTSLTHLAAMLRRAGVTQDFVEVIVRAVNERGDPLDDDELGDILRSNSGPLCDQLGQPCGDLCLKQRMKGLKDYPGQLRGAAVGEKVVVTVEARKGDELTLAHSDVSKMRGVLKDG